MNSSTSLKILTLACIDSSKGDERGRGGGGRFGCWVPCEQSSFTFAEKVKRDSSRRVVGKFNMTEK